MGRVGALSAGVGSYNVVYGYTAFGTGWGDTVGAKSLFNLGDRDRMDNTVTYVTPKFGGLTAYAQYSFNANGAEDAQSSLNKRCAGLGPKYDLGAFSTGLVVDTVMNKGTDANSEDSLGVSWGASYDFGVAKVLMQKLPSCMNIHVRKERGAACAPTAPSIYSRPFSAPSRAPFVVVKSLLGRTLRRF